ncbi:MAG TPA: hypothetical protein VEM57_09090, partial [Candidatus Binatus sp.]|nr:hypothetical protein [Candidatus Binatus sp.]
PRWVTGREHRGSDPLAVYEHTYTAMSAGRAHHHGGDSRRGSLVRRAGISAVLIAALVLAVLAVLAGVRPLELAWPWRRHTIPAARIPPPPRPAYAPEVIGTTPARPKAAVRVGDTRDFAVAAAGPDLRFGWTVDGQPAGTGPRWSYAPRAADVGRRRVEVVVSGREGAEVRSWNVRVKAARPPQVVEAQPASPAVDVVARSSLRLRVDPRPATPNERLVTAWQIDGVPAGDGNSFTLRPERPGVTVVRAVVRSDLGPTVTREWRIMVAPAPEEPPTEETRATQESEERDWPPVDRPRERERPATRMAEPAPPFPRYATPPSDRTPRDQDVRRWLERYAAAWRAHDVEALRRMGQVTTDGEAAALRRYFEGVRDLDVELNVIAMRTDGDRTTVRFTRLDRFRDPMGRLVLKESPMLEKEVVRTPDGLRFVGPTG